MLKYTKKYQIFFSVVLRASCANPGVDAYSTYTNFMNIREIWQTGFNATPHAVVMYCNSS